MMAAPRDEREWHQPIDRENMWWTLKGEMYGLEADETVTVVPKFELSRVETERDRALALNADCHRYQQAAEDRLNPVMAERDALKNALEEIAGADPDPNSEDQEIARAALADLEQK